MAGPWPIAAFVAVHVLVVGAQGTTTAPIPDILLASLGHLDQRQVPSSVSVSGYLTTSLITVATICSDNRGFGPAPTPGSDFQTTSATARLPGGDSTVFATRLRRQTDQPGTATNGSDPAHLVSGTDGCSTLFTATTFSACSTVVSPIGLPPVTVTECNQYVTFSSEILFMCPPTPTITPKPASTSQFNSLAGSFTQRPNLSQNDTFMNASTTYTPGIDFNDIELASSTTRSFSGAVGMPMSVPRRFHAEKRQLMFDRTGKPMETEAAIIAPGKHLNPRQLMFGRHGSGVVTDLVIVAPSTTITEEQTASTNMNERQMMMASGMTGTGDLMPPDQTGIGVDTAVTTLMPIPDILKAKDKRRHVAIGHKIRAEDSSTLLILNTTLSIDNSTTNATFAPNSSNSTRLSLKAAKLETIRLANANAAARNAQVPSVQNLSPPSPTKFYAAPWSEVIIGGIPEHVLGITCYGGGEHIGKCTEPDSDGDPEECECVTERQSWSISTITETRVGTTVVSYTGPLVITGAGGAETTTSVRFLSTMETTRSFVDSLVVKKTLTGDKTVTRTMTSLASATVILLPVGGAKAAAPQDAPGTVTSASDEATTVQVTSYVATETVTVPPAEETGDVAGNEMVPGTESGGSVDVTNVKRNEGGDFWPWTWKLRTGGAKVRKDQK